MEHLTPASVLREIASAKKKDLNPTHGQTPPISSRGAPSRLPYKLLHRPRWIFEVLGSGEAGFFWPALAKGWLDCNSRNPFFFSSSLPRPSLSSSSLTTPSVSRTQWRGGGKGRD